MARSAMPFVELISLDRCQVGGGTFVKHGDLGLAVFRLADPERVIVLDDECPHAGGSLAGGDVDGHTVACPWHQWEFDLTTGECTHLDRVQVRRHPAEVRDGVVWVDLPANPR